MLIKGAHRRILAQAALRLLVDVLEDAAVRLAERREAVAKIVGRREALVDGAYGRASTQAESQSVRPAFEIAWRAWIRPAFEQRHGGASIQQSVGKEQARGPATDNDGPKA